MTIEDKLEFVDAVDAEAVLIMMVGLGDTVIRTAQKPGADEQCVLAIDAALENVALGLKAAQSGGVEALGDLASGRTPFEENEP